MIRSLHFAWPPRAPRRYRVTVRVHPGCPASDSYYGPSPAEPASIDKVLSVEPDGWGEAGNAAVVARTWAKRLLDTLREGGVALDCLEEMVAEGACT